MKYLKKINEWKDNSPETRKIDQDNSDEIRDLFLELQDLGCVLTIDIDTHIEESYNLKYHLGGTTLGFSVDVKNYEHSFEEEIQKNKQNLERLNGYMNLSHDFIQRLKSIGYRIAWFRTNHDYIRGFESDVIQTEIRMSKK